MKKFIPLFILVIFSTFLSAQTKYYIYFKDKGVSSATALHKTSSMYKDAEKALDPKAIERRKQVMGENYITFEDLPINEKYIEQVTSLNIKIENNLRWFNAVTAFLTDDQVKAINNLPFIEKLEPVKVFNYKKNIEFIQSQPSIQLVSNKALKKTTSLDYGGSITQNALSDIPTVHDLGITGSDVYVGILDDGFSYKTYNALKTRNVIKEYDYVHHRSYVSNQFGKDGFIGHGSNVFCLMAGYDPGKAIGPAFGAKFFLAMTEYDSTETNIEEDNYVSALQDMEAAGVNITSSSLGYNLFDKGQTSYTYQDMNGVNSKIVKAVNLAWAFGVLSFTAAGNEGTATDWYYGTSLGGNSWGKIVTPGDAFNVITVGAVDSQNRVASFSSRGPTSDGRIKPEIVAMGSSDTVPLSDGKNYTTGSGTSYATPIAAGIGALLKSCWPHLTNSQMRKIILETGDSTSAPTNNRGWGLISAKRVISYPNLSSSGSTYQINKIFIDANGVNTATVKLNYKIGNTAAFQIVSMTYDGSLKYNYSLPVSGNGDVVEFYFTYNNNGGSIVREPAVKNYKFLYGNLLISGIDDNKTETLPVQFSLKQNYPNPFNPSTVISYELPAAKHVTLKVFDLLGREVATLVDGYQQAGKYNTQFSTLNSKLSSAVYLYRLQTGDFSATKKMLLIK